MLFVRLLDIFWTILPFFHPEGSGKLLDLVWMSLGPLALIGGTWMFLFANNLKKHALLPNHEQIPLVEALEHA